jgi:hypothetical protein
MAGKLANVRHEAFCRYVAKDKMTYAAAYVAAGFSEGGKTNASTLAKQQNIVERIDELLAIYEADDEADEEALKVEIKDMMTQITIDGAPAEKAILNGLVRCYHAGVKGAPVSSAVAALKLLGQERGMFQEKPKDQTPAEKVKALADESRTAQVLPFTPDAQDAFLDALEKIGEKPEEEAAADEALRLDPEAIPMPVNKISALFGVEAHDDESEV